MTDQAWILFDELAEVSGLTQPAAVRRWLEERGVPYLTRPDGRPVTRASVIDSVLMRGASLSTEPDFSGL
jgi:hypothetical protein